MSNVVFLDIDGVLNTRTSCVAAPSGVVIGIDESRVGIFKKHGIQIYGQTEDKFLAGREYGILKYIEE